MVNKGMGSNDLMAGGADGEARRRGLVENGIKVSASCLHTDSSYLKASFLPATGKMAMASKEKAVIASVCLPLSQSDCCNKTCSSVP